MKIFDIVYLTAKNQRLKNELTRLKNTHKSIIDDSENKVISTEKDYNTRLKEEKRKIDKAWSKKYGNLKVKIRLLREDFNDEKKKLLKRFQEIENQANQIFHLGIEIQPYVDRLTIIRGEEINNAGAIKSAMDRFKLKYEKFKNDILEYTEEIEVENKSLEVGNE